MKIFSFLIPIFIFACEFRPPTYLFQTYPEAKSRCKFPIDQVHIYGNESSSTITECYYSSNQKLAEELIFDVNSAELVGMVTYSYKHTYYLKTIFDYVNGDQNNHYVVKTYYVDGDLL